MNRGISRREFCHYGAWTLTGLGLSRFATGALLAAEAGLSSGSFRIETIDRTTVKVPFREVPQRAMDREIPHWRYSEICEVQLASGARGLGETMLFYTWGVTSDEDVQRALGQSAADLMWEDSLGAGLQMALFDAVARTLGVPLHALLGEQVHQRTPLSWWNIDMPPVDMASECQEAHRQGYMSYKTKGRPWFDLWAQVDAVSAVVPETFKLDMDFNDTLLDAERAIPILTELESNPRLDIYETPIPQSDVEGNRRITAETRVNVALHYGTPRPRIVVAREVCDGFVIGGGASRVMQQGHFAGQVGMPFWLQLVGTEITAAYSLHFGAVLGHAIWPAVNCHQLYSVNLLDRKIEVRDGYATVPDEPGLGFELNRDAVDRLKVEKPAERPEPERLVETTWPDGRHMYVANDGEVNFMLRAAMQGKYPYFERGVESRPLPNDGSAAWRRLYDQARSGPVVTK